MRFIQKFLPIDGLEGKNYWSELESITAVHIIKSRPLKERVIQHLKATNLIMELCNTRSYVTRYLGYINSCVFALLYKPALSKLHNRYTWISKIKMSQIGVKSTIEEKTNTNVYPGNKNKYIRTLLGYLLLLSRNEGRIFCKWRCCQSGWDRWFLTTNHYATTYFFNFYTSTWCYIECVRQKVKWP